MSATIQQFRNIGLGKTCVIETGGNSLTRTLEAIGTTSVTVSYWSTETQTVNGVAYTARLQTFAEIDLVDIDSVERVSAGVWDTVRANFNTLLTSLVATYSLLTETPGGPGIETSTPQTRLNGTYSLQLNTVNGVNREVNSYLMWTLPVRLKVLFLINQTAKADPDLETSDANYGVPVNDKAEYNNAVGDILAIIKKRLDVSSYQGVFDSCDLMGQPEFRYLDEAETMLLATIDFSVGISEQF